MNKIEAKQDNRLELAVNLHNQVMLGVFVTASAIKRIRDERLYEELDCNSFKEYIETMAPISKTQAYVCIKIAEKFKPYLPGSFQASGNELTDGSDNEESVHTCAHDLESFGWNKLQGLARLEDSDLKELLEGGTLSSEDGSSISLDELKEMTARRSAETLQKIRREHNKKLAKLQEDNKTLQEEKKSKEKQIEKLNAEIDMTEDIRKKWHALDSRYAVNRQRLDDIRGMYGRMRQLFFQIKVEDEYPEEFKKDILDFVRKLDDFHKFAMDAYWYLMDELGL